MMRLTEHEVVRFLELGDFRIVVHLMCRPTTIEHQNKQQLTQGFSLPQDRTQQNVHEIILLLRWVKFDMRTGANISILTFDEDSVEVLVNQNALEVEGDRDDVVFELEKLDVDHNDDWDYDGDSSKTHQEEYLGCYHHESIEVLYSNITWFGEANSPQR